MQGGGGVGEEKEAERGREEKRHREEPTRTLWGKSGVGSAHIGPHTPSTGAAPCAPPRPPGRQEKHTCTQLDLCSRGLKVKVFRRLGRLHELLSALALGFCGDAPQLRQRLDWICVRRGEHSSQVSASQRTNTAHGRPRPAACPSSRSKAPSGSGSVHVTHTRRLPAVPAAPRCGPWRRGGPRARRSAGQRGSEGCATWTRCQRPRTQMTAPARSSAPPCLSLWCIAASVPHATAHMCQRLSTEEQRLERAFFHGGRGRRRAAALVVPASTAREPRMARS